MPSRGGFFPHPPLGSTPTAIVVSATQIQLSQSTKNFSSQSTENTQRVRKEKEALQHPATPREPKRALT